MGLEKRCQCHLFPDGAGPGGGYVRQDGIQYGREQDTEISAGQADLAFFRLEGMDRNCMFGRMDFVESLLRRDVRGIRLSEVEVEEDGKIVVW